MKKFAALSLIAFLHAHPGHHHHHDHSGHNHGGHSHNDGLGSGSKDNSKAEQERKKRELEEKRKAKEQARKNHFQLLQKHLPSDRFTTDFKCFTLNTNSKSSKDIEVKNTPDSKNPKNGQEVSFFSHAQISNDVTNACGDNTIHFDAKSEGKSGEILGSVLNTNHKNLITFKAGGYVHGAVEVTNGSNELHFFGDGAHLRNEKINGSFIKRTGVAGSVASVINVGSGSNLVVFGEKIDKDTVSEETKSAIEALKSGLFLEFGKNLIISTPDSVISALQDIGDLNKTSSNSISPQSSNTTPAKQYDPKDAENALKNALEKANVKLSDHNIKARKSKRRRPMAAKDLDELARNAISSAVMQSSSPKGSATLLDSTLLVKKVANAINFNKEKGAGEIFELVNEADGKNEAIFYGDGKIGEINNLGSGSNRSIFASKAEVGMLYAKSGSNLVNVLSHGVIGDFISDGGENVVTLGSYYANMPKRPYAYSGKRDISILTKVEMLDSKNSVDNKARSSVTHAKLKLSDKVPDLESARLEVKNYYAPKNENEYRFADIALHASNASHITAKNMGTFYRVYPVFDNVDIDSNEYLHKVQALRYDAELYRASSNGKSTQGSGSKNTGAKDKNLLAITIAKSVKSASVKDGKLVKKLDGKSFVVAPKIVRGFWAHEVVLKEVAVDENLKPAALGANIAYFFNGTSVSVESAYKNIALGVFTAPIHLFHASNYIANHLSFALDSKTIHKVTQDELQNERLARNEQIQKANPQDAKDFKLSAWGSATAGRIADDVHSFKEPFFTQKLSVNGNFQSVIFGVDRLNKSHLLGGTLALNRADITSDAQKNRNFKTGSPIGTTILSTGAEAGLYVQTFDAIQMRSILKLGVISNDLTLQNLQFMEKGKSSNRDRVNNFTLDGQFSLGWGFDFDGLTFTPRVGLDYGFIALKKNYKFAQSDSILLAKSSNYHAFGGDVGLDIYALNVLDSDAVKIDLRANAKMRASMRGVDIDFKNEDGKLSDKFKYKKVKLSLPLGLGMQFREDLWSANLDLNANVSKERVPFSVQLSYAKDI